MWNKLSQLGITNDLDRQAVKRVKLINQLSLILAALAIQNSLTFVFLGLGIESAVLAAVGVALLGVPLLNKHRSYLSAVLLMVPLINLAILYFSLALGKDAGSYLVFFYAAILPWLVFGEKQRVYAFSASLLSVGLYLYIALSNPATPGLLSAAVVSFLYISASVITFAVLVITFILFRNDSARTELFLGSTNDILQETKKKLQHTLSENSAVIAFATTMYNNAGSIDVLCNAGLYKLKELVPFTYGAVILYNKQDDMLRVQTEHGYNGSERRALVFKNGTTLAGDAFLRHKTIRIQNAPERYWHAASATGSVQPAELLIIPMTFKEQVGVLELALMKLPDEHIMAMLSRISVAFAANILSLESNEENASLVTVLQQQKEALASSYAELEQIREKTDARMREQYMAQQTLIKQVIEKGRQREQELQDTINALSKK